MKKESLSFELSKLLFVSSDGNYVEFCLRNGKPARKIPIRNSITNIEQQFRDIPHYFRYHRAFIVNLKTVVSKKGNSLGYQLTLQDCHQKIPVFRQKVKAFDKLYREVAS
ncbi:MAG: LytTR family transcriptional regulator DNA-binding domain-containing protein [Bacteroidales bacterium]|nr:LytTR family transcriptional regulator DNA-binding domain-containing protein [Bacteroidales bacterium]